MVVEVRELLKIYPLSNGKELRALEIDHLRIKKGELVGLLGKSGSGKTTLLRILRGVEKFNRGEVSIDGIVLKPDSPAEDFRKVMEKTAIHLQRSFGLWSEKVIENVIRALAYVQLGEEVLPEWDPVFYEGLKEEAMKLLEIVELKHKAECWAEILSGGEKQRLILARQLAKKPSILLLDEFGTMTCPETRKKAIEVIKRVNKELGITVIFSSHMPEIHRALAERVVLIGNGRVLDEGEAEEMIKKFLSELEAPKVGKKRIGGEVIRLENVRKRYYVIPGGQTLDLKDVSFSIRRGEIVGFIGRSGSGKTVLARLISGLELPDEGKIRIRIERKWVDFSNFGRRSVEVRRKIGILHQEFALPFWAKVSEMISYKIRIKKETAVEEAMKKAEKIGISESLFDAIYRLTDLPKEEAEIRLKRLGLSYGIIKELFPESSEDLSAVYPILERLNLPNEILDRESHELSGGEAIRLGIVLASITKPKILILDEPFGDIDPVTLRKVANFLKEMNLRDRTTMLIVSHQHELVKELADRVLLVEDGKVQEVK
ncbi:MAG: ATP-binding cassette domain-containing protein [Archaeoglobaceae archaeon]|nr:ATP-binding cassette domain-containing protein [Archaeoglobaceae archaeon]MDW8128561.1 ATP-binding cassette domain-containing protein [Archaeoglobaceae archaeon]